jgi:Cip1-like, core domain/Cellulose binding domain
MPSTLVRRPVLIVTVVLATLAALATAVLTRMPAANAATGCQVSYVNSQWTGGFTASVQVTAADAHSGWAVTWTWPSGQQVTSAWNATVVQAGSVVTATNLSYNGQIAAGGSVSFGVQGTWTSANTPPTDFALDGVACAGPGAGSTSPSAAPSSPAPSTTGPSSPAPSTTGPSSQPAPGCGTAAFCDGFENQTTGTPGGSWSVVYPDCSGTGTATVDSTVAHTGTRSVRIDGGSGYCNHVFIRAATDLTTIGQVLYARFYIRHSTALPTDHVAFLSMPDAADGNKALRMGGQNAALQWNRESDDATLPVQSPVGVAQSVPLPTGVWSCVEFGVSGVDGTLRTWLNGTAVPGLIEDGVPTPDIDQQWLTRTWRPSLTALRLGWESYGGGTDTLWFDDVAVGASRIGC